MNVTHSLQIQVRSPPSETGSPPGTVCYSQPSADACSILYIYILQREKKKIERPNMYTKHNISNIYQRKYHTWELETRDQPTQTSWAAGTVNLRETQERLFRMKHQHQ